MIATAPENTRWRLESRDNVTGTNAWQSLTNITLGPSPFILDQLIDLANRCYRGTWLP